MKVTITIDPADYAWLVDEAFAAVEEFPCGTFPDDPFGFGAVFLAGALKLKAGNSARLNRIVDRAVMGSDEEISGIHADGEVTEGHG